MNFDFDHNRSAANKQKHGINFEDAKYLWLDYRRVEINALTYGINRKLIIAKWKGEIWSAVFSIRANAIRLMSARKSTEYEQRIYCSSKI